MKNLGYILLAVGILAVGATFWGLRGGPVHKGTLAEKSSSGLGPTPASRQAAGDRRVTPREPLVRSEPNRLPSPQPEGPRTRGEPTTRVAPVGELAASLSQGIPADQAQAIAELMQPQPREALELPPYPVTYDLTHEEILAGLQESLSASKLSPDTVDFIAQGLERANANLKERYTQYYLNNTLEEKGPSR